MIKCKSLRESLRLFDRGFAFLSHSSRFTVSFTVLFSMPPRNHTNTRLRQEKDPMMDEFRNGVPEHVLEHCKALAHIDVPPSTARHYLAKWDKASRKHVQQQWRDAAGSPPLVMHPTSTMTTTELAAQVTIGAENGPMAMGAGNGSMTNPVTNPFANGFFWLRVLFSLRFLLSYRLLRLPILPWRVLRSLLLQARRVVLYPQKRRLLPKVRRWRIVPRPPHRHLWNFVRWQVRRWRRLVLSAIPRKNGW